MKTFMDRAIAGEFEDLDKAIDDAIEEWHTGPHDPEVIGETIHLFLGMTWQEYADWVMHPKHLHSIVDKRRS